MRALLPAGSHLKCKTRIKFARIAKIISREIDFALQRSNEVSIDLTSFTRLPSRETLFKGVGRTLFASSFISLDINIRLLNGNIDVLNKLDIGNDVVLARSVLITTSGGVTIGNRVLVGYGAKILSADHRIPDDPLESIYFSGHVCKPVVIEDDVWICANAVIVAGVRIGRGSVVAAGAIVTKDVESYSIVGGVPAKLIRKR